LWRIGPGGWNQVLRFIATHTGQGSTDISAPHGSTVAVSIRGGEPSRRLLAQGSSTHNADKTARQILLRFGSLRIPMTPAAKFLSIAPIET